MAALKIANVRSTMLLMSNAASHQDDKPLYEMLDDAGKAWFDRVVDAFNAGGYEDALKGFLADEAAAGGFADD